MDEAPKQRAGKRARKSAAPPTASQAPPHPELVPDAGVDPARREKIEKIKQALADGTYRISDEDVARKLIDHMRGPKS